jgi:tRNA(fMet)-specific endonuclease VapC
LTVPSYLLDTNICIYIHHRRPTQMVERFKRVKSGDAVISVVTYGELLFGAQKSQRRAEALQVIEEFASTVGVMPMPVRAAAVYGDLRARLEARGEMIGGNDLWIASHAKAEGLTLVTNNEREFKRVPGLNVENWVK